MESRIIDGLREAFMARAPSPPSRLPRGLHRLHPAPLQHTSSFVVSYAHITIIHAT